MSCQLGTVPDDPTARTHCEQCTQSATVVNYERCTQLGALVETGAETATVVQVAKPVGDAMPPAAGNPLRWFVFAVVIAVPAFGSSGVGVTDVPTVAAVTAETAAMSGVSTGAAASKPRMIS